MSQATEAFWLLSDPFEPRPDIRFLVPSRPIRTVVSALEQTLHNDSGQWTLLVGPPGVGKGVVVQLFGEAWTGAQRLVVIPDTSVPYGELCAQIQEQLDPSASDSGTIIFLDGAEELSSEVISAFERDEEQLGPSTRFVVVLDQPPESPTPDWAEQRGATVIPLEPMDAAETLLYVQRRVRLAAGGDRDLFEESAIRELHRRSDGLPKAINELARRALDRAAALGEPWVTTDAVSAAARELGNLNLPVVEALDLDTPATPDDEAPSPQTSESQPLSVPPVEPDRWTPHDESLATDVVDALPDQEEWQTDVILEEERVPSAPPATLIAFAAWLIGMMMGAAVTLYLLGSWEPLRASRAPHFPVIARALNEGEVNRPERPERSLEGHPTDPSPPRSSPLWPRSKAHPES